MRFIGKFAASNSQPGTGEGAVRAIFIVSQSFLPENRSFFRIATIHHNQILLHGIRSRPH